MYADLPQVDNILYTEVPRSYDIILEHVRNYDVKKLLIDASNSLIEVPKDIFTRTFPEFMQRLAKTRVKKVARLASSGMIREKVVKKVLAELVVPFQF